MCELRRNLFSNFIYGSSHLVYFLITYVKLSPPPALCFFTFDSLFPLPILKDAHTLYYNKL